MNLTTELLTKRLNVHGSTRSPINPVPHTYRFGDLDLRFGPRQPNAPVFQSNSRGNVLAPVQSFGHVLSSLTTHYTRLSLILALFININNNLVRIRNQVRIFMFPIKTFWPCSIYKTQLLPCFYLKHKELWIKRTDLPVVFLRGQKWNFTLFFCT